MNALFVVGAPGDPADARFLNVVQGSDVGTALAPATLVESTGGSTYQGALVHQTVVLFAVKVGAPFVGLSYAVPVTTTGHLVTGLAPASTYYVTQQTADGMVSTHIDSSPGGSPLITDTGGVLVIGSIERFQPPFRRGPRPELQPETQSPQRVAARRTPLVRQQPHQPQ